MGILLTNRNLLSKFKPKSISLSSFCSPSSDLCFFRRFLSPAAVPPGTIDPQAQAPTVVGDMKPNSKSMFLIDHVYKGITNYSQLSAASENNNNSWKDHHPICSPFSGKRADLVGSCKEWTLFWIWDVEEDEYGNSYPVFSLWNPTTNRIKTLPPPWLDRPIQCNIYTVDCFGFGFDPKSQEDYKIVRFLQYDYVTYFVHIELYSFKTDSWKRIDPSFFVDSPRTSKDSIHVNGVYYWAMDFILAFDFAHEDFTFFPLPDKCLAESEEYCLAEFQGSLALILPYLVPSEDLTEEEKQKQLQQPFSIKIWVWNGDTWDVGPRVAVGDYPVGDKIARAIRLFQNEFLFLQGYVEPELMLFNCKTGKLEKLGIRHDPLVTTPEPPWPDVLPWPNVFPFTVPL